VTNRRRRMPGATVRRSVPIAVLAMAMFFTCPAAAADETARFIAACGKPERDVTVLDSFMPPRRTLFYDRWGFWIFFGLPKQTQGPVPAACAGRRDTGCLASAPGNGRWYWPGLKPPYNWQYEGVACHDVGAPAAETITPCCNITVIEKPFHYIRGAMCNCQGTAP